MSKTKPSILRNVYGEFLTELNADESTRYELLAHDGKVIRSQEYKKGRTRTIFRLKEKPAPDALPSLSNNSDCCLEESDSRWISGEMGEPSRAQQERWIGWGLVTA